MDWGEYKPLAQTSRDLIVLPFFRRALQGQTGVCLDIGCGSGDITTQLADDHGLSIVGIDKDPQKQLYKKSGSGSVHLIKADIEKNGILEAGIEFDCAFSNCCFCHLSDASFIDALVDTYNSLKEGSKLIFLVPSIDWAMTMYKEIKHNPSGITAIPRFGGRQSFRTAHWYSSALRRAGFVDVVHEEVLIPSDARLDKRYLDHAGTPLFSGFIATRGKVIPNEVATRKAFEIAHENRKLEIQLFWQRSLFFWGFVAAALVGYAQTIKDAPEYSIVFALFGLVCSIAWSRGNRGSKYWQEYWEKKVNFFQHYVTGNIFFDRRPTTPSLLDIFEGRRVSVSKLTMALSDFCVFMWLALCAATFIDPDYLMGQVKMIGATFTVATLVYCIFFLRKSKSED